MTDFNNKKVVITRPIQRSEVLADLIRQNNGIPVIIPTLELKVVESDELRYITENIDEFDWIIFTSPSGVESFFNLYGEHEIPSKIAVIGVKTEEELKKHANTATMIPEKFTAEGLLEVFAEYDMKDKKVALPRTLSARKILPETLEKFGAKVCVAEAYKSAIPDDTTDILSLADDIINSNIDIITFTSPLTFTNLLDVIRNSDEDKYNQLLDALRENVLVASIGPITGAKIREHNITPIEPSRYTVIDMINSILSSI
ncbi:uroporphyrinogen-III synthase [Methanosphaera cuniculi]|uniref:uroporphyrinogen-III synthase n=1 Tax=Methanosphaera cuniculi TaxID=1077256 RepID=UPI0026F008FF|nr:uroporphyrinogen-III synthase [Methanosphaera cuniculi]